MAAKAEKLIDFLSCNAKPVQVNLTVVFATYTHAHLSLRSDGENCN